MGAARELRALSWLLEVGLYVFLTSAVFAVASVYPWARAPFWGGAFVLVGLLLARGAVVQALRGRIGRRLFSIHPSGLWLVLDDVPSYGLPAWSFDLGRPLLSVGPLLLPGAAFLALVLFQLLLLPPWLVAALTRARADALAADPSAWLPLTVSVSHTRTGAGFLAALLGLHLVAGAVLAERAARTRFRRFLAVLATALALVALAQMASGATAVYGRFAAPGAGGSHTIFGPFPNRNHFAGYMLLLAAPALHLVLRAFAGYRQRAGRSSNWRRRVVALQSPEGTALFLALVPAGAALCALVASNSRGGLLAFGLSLLLASALRPAPARRAALVLAALLTALAVSWFGTARLGARYGRLAQDLSGRTAVWSDTLSRMSGLWLTGSGFNTFVPAMSRATVFELPRGATAWRAPYEVSVTQAPRLGYRVLGEVEGLAWYAHAHSDYLQVLVETGVPGLLLALAAATLLLRQARNEPWLLAALLGVLMQSLIDFPLQMPACAALFAVLAAWPRKADNNHAGRGPEASLA